MSLDILGSSEISQVGRSVSICSLECRMLMAGLADIRPNVLPISVLPLGLGHCLDRKCDVDFLEWSADALGVSSDDLL